MKADRCPFCGAEQPEPPFFDSEYGACVSCYGCSAQGPTVVAEDGETEVQTQAKALELWNRRTLGRAERQLDVRDY